MLGTLLERPLISRDFQHKYPKLISMYNAELDEAKVIFDRQLLSIQSPEGPVINKNMPYIAGLLKWSKELRDRVDNGMSKLKTINHGYDVIVVAHTLIVEWLLLGQWKVLKQ